MINQYILSIDPAGIGTTGVVIYERFTNKIFAHFSFKSPSWRTAINNLKLMLTTFNRYYLLFYEIPFYPQVILIEDYEIWNMQKLKQPTATAKAIGGYISLLEFYFNWPQPILQSPNCKNNFLYQGSWPLNKHEQDAWKHLQYFLKFNKF